jgi:hypothetical protein
MRLTPASSAIKITQLAVAAATAPWLGSLVSLVYYLELQTVPVLDDFT